MSIEPCSDDLLRETVAVYVANDRSQTKTAEQLNLARSTLQHRLARARERGLLDNQTSMVSLPSFVLDGDEEEDIKDILNRFRKGHDIKAKAAAARNWFEIRVKETKPYALLWFGDPHLGPHTAWPILEKHIAIARQDGVYGANIGDTTNSWPWTGRMARLWAESDISHKTERRLAEWFMFEAGIQWLLWILGNHDEWNNKDFYKKLGAYAVPVIDWRAKFTLVHNNGSKTRIDAAHGRKGSSIYNPTHGTLRDAKFGEDAALYVTGHTHNFGLFEYEMPERKTNAWLAQVRGYKVFDDYALVNGFAESQKGHAIMSIIDPATGAVQCFADPEEGAAFLKWKRR